MSNRMICPNLNCLHQGSRHHCLRCGTTTVSRFSHLGRTLARICAYRIVAAASPLTDSQSICYPKDVTMIQLMDSDVDLLEDVLQTCRGRVVLQDGVNSSLVSRLTQVLGRIALARRGYPRAQAVPRKAPNAGAPDIERQ